MDSYQAKIGWKRMRNSEKKNYRSVPFRSYPTRNRNFQKNSKKIDKIKKNHYGLFSSENRLEKPGKERKCREREKIKIIVLFSSNLTG